MKAQDLHTARVNQLVKASRNQLNYWWTSDSSMSKLRQGKYVRCSVGERGLLVHIDSFGKQLTVTWRMPKKAAAEVVASVDTLLAWSLV